MATVRMTVMEEKTNQMKSSRVCQYAIECDVTGTFYIEGRYGNVPEYECDNVICTRPSSPVSSFSYESTRLIP